MAAEPKRTRAPAVAGRFYPRNPARLAAEVDRLLDAIDVPDTEPLAPAYVVPHAAYLYSGPTAAHVYARLRRHAADIRRVVLVGPAHFVAIRGCVAPSSAAWATPLGELPVEAPAVADHLAVDDAPHAPEHSLEVQLPLLQRALPPGVPILPIVVGAATTDELVACLTGVAGDDLSNASACGTVVLCSTDLSHYLDRASAVRRDNRTATVIGALAAEQVGVRDACGVLALRGLLGWARTRALRAELLDLSTSADTAGDPSRVVGYGAFALHGRGGGQR